MATFLLKYSKDAKDFAFLELSSVFDYNQDSKISEYEDCFLLNNDLEKLDFYFFKSVYKVIAKINLLKDIENLNLKFKTFFIETNRYTEKNVKELAHYVWEAIAKNSTPKVSSKGKIITLIGDYLVEKVWENKGSYKRHPKFRKQESFHPTIVIPKTANALINLANSDAIIDPFAGAGGIAYEAYLRKKKVYAGDINLSQMWRLISLFNHKKEFISLPREKREALLKKGIREENLIIINKSALDLKEKDIPFEDYSFVFDPPYGKLSHTSEKPNDLLDKFLSLVKNFKFRYIVFMYPNNRKLKIPRELKVIGNAEMFVNDSLTRKVWVLRKRL